MKIIKKEIIENYTIEIDKKVLGLLHIIGWNIKPEFIFNQLEDEYGECYSLKDINELFEMLKDINTDR